MMLLSEAAIATNGQMTGPDVTFGAVCTDSRSVKPGDLFVALRGENFDGHDYVADCLGRGAVAAIVDQPSALSPQSFLYQIRALHWANWLPTGAASSICRWRP